MVVPAARLDEWERPSIDQPVHRKAIMNRALLLELQGQRAYPSITLLMNTTPGFLFDANEKTQANRLAEQADARLAGDVDDNTRTCLIETLLQLIDEQSTERSAMAVAFCVSADYAAAVQLGREVDERVVIDETFATRDLVADLNRTARYRVVAISDRTIRMFVGDRNRLVEERGKNWPFVRQSEQNTESWTRDLTQRLRAEHAQYPLPTVVAGVERTVRRCITPDVVEAIGFVPGNHDKTSWVDLHHAVWPLVTDWLRTDTSRALAALDRARSARLYAGGIDEIWPLANEGRIEVLVVEEDYAVPARVDGNHQVHLATDREAVDVIDDIVDETIEAVLLHGGNAVMVSAGELQSEDRISAILRY
jgi:Bacterial archaeo-eukaryotic release factor family 3